MSVGATHPSPTVAWHDVECDGYAADLELWLELAADARGPLLELGCGTGRVTLRLAGAGHAVTGLDRDAGLLAELRRRALDRELDLAAVEADARDFRLPRRFALVLAPMQVAQLFDRAGRRGMLTAAAAHLSPGGRLAVALLDDDADPAQESHPPPPDVRELGGWVYSSLPIEVRRDTWGIEVRRLRQLVSPSGELSEELDVTRLERVTADQLEREAAGCGLRPAERRAIAPTPDHLGSTVVVLEGA